MAEDRRAAPGQQQLGLAHPRGPARGQDDHSDRKSACNSRPSHSAAIPQISTQVASIWASSGEPGAQVLPWGAFTVFCPHIGIMNPPTTADPSPSPPLLQRNAESKGGEEEPAVANGATTKGKWYNGAGERGAEVSCLAFQAV
jgi:hypothetical protein